MFENVRRFLSPINQAVIVFQIEHELAMGGPLFGRVSLLIGTQSRSMEYLVSTYYGK